MTLSNKNILLIAGPSASGKTHFIRKLLNGGAQISHKRLIQELELRPNLNIGKLNIERLTNEKKVNKRSKKMRKDLFIVHFDFTSRHQHQRRCQLKAIASKCHTLKTSHLTWHLTPGKGAWLKGSGTNFMECPLQQAFWIYAHSLINNKHGRRRFNSVYQEWDSFLDTIPTNERLFFNSETGQLRTI